MKFLFLLLWVTSGSYVLASDADEGCDIIRNQANEFSYPFAKTDDFIRLENSYSNRQDFLSKYGLVEASEEQKKSINAELPMGFTFSADKKLIHVNCYLCHGGLVQGRPFEGAANTKLRFQELADDLQWKPITSKAFYMSGGVLGFKNYPGATAALDMSIIAESSRNETGNLSYFKSVSNIIEKYFFGYDKPLPVYPTPWWIFSPGLKNSRFYSTGVTDQSSIHIMQFALASKLKGDQIKNLKPLFDKILSCVKNKRPPQSETVFDTAKWNEGRDIFYGLMYPEEKNCDCIKCHGITDGSKDQFYPEKYVSHSLIKTDFAFLEKMLQPEVGENHAKIVKLVDPTAKLYDPHENPSYLAPPLVAMFTKTALLHNKSVPTIEHLICTDEKDRPKKWSWKSEPNIFEAGEVITSGRSALAWPIYNTNGHGFGNQGHNFCQPLKNDKAACLNLVEYLKSL